jgi:hypothetical protein
MRRLSLEISGTLVLSFALAAGVFAAGVGPLAAPPFQVDPRGDSGARCWLAPLRPVARSGIQGSVQLCSGVAGVEAVVQAEHLAVGSTYALWLSYLDQERPRVEESLLHELGERPSGERRRLDGSVASSTQMVYSGRFGTLQPSGHSEITLWLFGVQPDAPGGSRSSAGQLLPLGSTDPPADPSGIEETGGGLAALLASARFVIRSAADPDG